MKCEDRDARHDPYHVTPSAVSGEVAAPPSKSLTIRAVAAALLAHGTSAIVNPAVCDDGLAALRVAETLGADVEVISAGTGRSRLPAATDGTGRSRLPAATDRAAGEKENRRPACRTKAQESSLPAPLTPDAFPGGRGEFVDGRGLPGVLMHSGGAPRTSRLDCRESGLVFRMFSAIAALSDKGFTLSARGTLRNRPVDMVRDLERLGVRCATRGGLPPVRIRGPLKGGRLRIDASVSSQFLTGLLMALPLCAEDSEIRVSRLASKAYVAMTLAVMRDFGVRVRNYDFRRFVILGRQRYMPRAYVVEGDWSGSAFMLVAGAVAGRVKVTGLTADSLQADKGMLAALKKAGAGVVVRNDAVCVSKTKLVPFEFDVSACPDLFPPLAVLAANCVGRSVFRGTGRLKHKESDRAGVIAAEFARIGVSTKVRTDSVEIAGGRIEWGRIDSHGDHRIAMAGAVAALTSAQGVTIDGWKCVAKSYPAFFTDLTRLCNAQTSRRTPSTRS